MKSFQVLRTHLSPYQSQNFTETEKKALEALSGIRYVKSDEVSLSEDLILITNTHTILRELDPGLLKRTRLIVHPNSGYDHFEKDHDLWSDIPLLVGHTIRAPAVAEYSLGCLFQASQELPQHLVWDKNRLWDRKLISNMTIWVYGHGHIGSVVTATLKSLGAKVVVVDPFVKGAGLKHWRDGNRTLADAHIICSSLNSSSYHLFNEEFFRSLKNDVIIINGARGKLIDEKSLREFLLSHPKAQAFLDVFEDEPFGTDWMNFPQVWKTSHIAGVSRDLDQRIIDFGVQAIRDFVTPGFAFSEKYKNELLQNKFVDGVLI